jgi:hypothetical protein
MYYRRKLIVGSPIVKHVATIAKAKIHFSNDSLGKNPLKGFVQ